MISQAGKSQHGIALVENLVAIAVLSIAIVGSVSLYGTNAQATKASRDYAALVSETQSIIDGYRNENFNTLILRFNTNPQEISSGAQVTESYTSARTQTTFTSKLTAIKSRPQGNPEAVRLQLSALQRRGKMGTANYSFETLLANIR
jgi:Tfp pilus assembly protein PilV